MQEFIGDASHELKTPLTTIRGYFDLFVKNISIDVQNEIYQKKIQSEILRMQSIIDNLLLITELEEQAASDLSESNISDLVQAMIDDLRLLQPTRVRLSNLI
jgi:two-component system OmpR family sensor kinase